MNSSIITLKGLEGNEPTQLHGLQIHLAPHSAGIELFWWIALFSTLAVVIVRTLHVVRK